MKYFIDTEFCENPGTIDLISIGMVSENGRSIYALNKNCDIDKAWKNKWLVDNVFLSIYKEYVHGDARNRVDFSKGTIKRIFFGYGLDNHAMQGLILSSIKDDEYPEFYGYYADYDWVVFCWIFGKMIDLPAHFPMYCKDLKQMMNDKGLTKKWKQENCPDPEGEHNALVDATWNRKLYNTMTQLIEPPKEP